MFYSSFCVVGLLALSEFVENRPKTNKWHWNSSTKYRKAGYTSRNNFYRTFNDMCNERVQRVSAEHTACLPVKLRKGAGVSRKDIRLIVDGHNFYRGNVERYRQPPATNMMKIEWDQEIAIIAQKWASNCQWMHDENHNRHIPGGMQLGQNIARGQFSWKQTLKMWHREVEDFKYGKGGIGVGHYVQMVWANTTKIGCGFAKCNKTRPFYVCDYGNPVVPDQQNTPYQTGKKGSACPRHFNKKRGLCDCGGKQCKNGGWLKPDSCQCNCVQNSWITGKDCSLDCDNAIDYIFCGSEGGKLTKKHCRKFADLPFKFCPVTCGLCAAQTQPDYTYDYDDYNSFE